MFSNFYGICVSDNLWLGPSAGNGGLNHHDVDGNGGPDIGHLVKLNMEARLAGRRGQLPEVMIFWSSWRHNGINWLIVHPSPKKIKFKKKRYIKKKNWNRFLAYF